jgi:hypothetical protein
VGLRGRRDFLWLSAATPSACKLAIDGVGCPSCGITRMTGPTCPNCLNPIDSTDKFCRNCGITLNPAVGQAAFGAPYQSPVLSQPPDPVGPAYHPDLTPPSRQEFLEIDDESRTLAAGYSPPLQPMPVLPTPPAYDPSIQDVPDTLAAGYRAPSGPATMASQTVGAPKHYGAQSGRCPKCGLNLPIYREKCPNCGGTVIPLGQTFLTAPDGPKPRINVGAYEITKSPVADFFIGVGVFFLLYATRFLGFDLVPIILIPVTWMVSRLFWRWFAHGLGLMTLIAAGIYIYLIVVHFQEHPFHMLP